MSVIRIAPNVVVRHAEIGKIFVGDAFLQPTSASSTDLCQGIAACNVLTAAGTRGNQSR